MPPFRQTGVYLPDQKFDRKKKKKKRRRSRKKEREREGKKERERERERKKERVIRVLTFVAAETRPPFGFFLPDQ